MHIHFILNEYDKAIGFQILEQTSLFIADRKDGFDFKASNGFCVRSLCNPQLGDCVVCLRGYSKCDYNNVVVKYFSSNKERDAYKKKLLEALEEWSKKFPKSPKKLNSNEYKF